MQPNPERPRGLAGVTGLAALIAAAVAGCVVARDREPLGRQHPVGWTEEASAAFHGKDLVARAFPLHECRACHGADDRGGPVGVGCTNAGCHAQPEGVGFCGTCHGGEAGPRPKTGAHDTHASLCVECHRVPTESAATGHLNGTVDLVFGGQATLGNKLPTYDPVTKTCAGVYCHGTATPKWEKPAGKTACDACHGAPPEGHVRWSLVADQDNCAACHEVPPASTHIDGLPALKPLACDACHGKGPWGAPAPALDGSAHAQSPGVGAHQRHLDADLLDRMGRAVTCARCHTVPVSVLAPGHLDISAPADVSFVGEERYMAATQSCVVGCHFDKNPGPVWTDDSGAARACDACHAFPPIVNRDGSLHTVVEGTLSACLGCHPFEASKHVDGLVDFLP